MCLNASSAPATLRLTWGFGPSWLLGFNHRTLAINTLVKAATAWGEGNHKWIRDVWIH